MSGVADSDPSCRVLRAPPYTACDDQHDYRTEWDRWVLRASKHQWRGQQHPHTTPRGADPELQPETKRRPSAWQQPEAADDHNRNYAEPGALRL